MSLVNIILVRFYWVEWRDTLHWTALKSSYRINAPWSLPITASSTAAAAAAENHFSYSSYHSLSHTGINAYCLHITHQTRKWYVNIKWLDFIFLSTSIFLSGLLRMVFEQFMMGICLCHFSHVFTILRAKKRKKLQKKKEKKVQRLRCDVMDNVQIFAWINEYLNIFNKIKLRISANIEPVTITR